jgi:hypothetical protein
LPGLEVSLKNHVNRRRGLLELTNSYNKLSGASGLYYVVRFQSGDVEVVRPGGPRYVSGSLPDPKPLYVSALGALMVTYGVGPDMFFFNRKARLAFKKGEKFCITAVVPEMEMRSNTVFVNGSFDLPKGHDPLKDERDWREARKRERDARR